MAALLIVLVAFAIRLLHVLSYDTAPTNDLSVYVDMALRILTLDNFHEGLFLRPPGYAFFLKPFFLFFDFDAAVKAVQIVQAALGAWTCLLIYRIGRRIHSRSAGLVSALVACFYSHFLFYSSVLMSETLFIPAYFASLLLFMRAMERPGRWRLFRAGIAAGAVVLIRPAGAALAPAALAAAWKGGGTRATRLRALAIIVAGGLSVLGPWILRNYVAHHRFVLIAPNGGQTLAASNNPEATGGHTTAPLVGGKNIWEREKLYMATVVEFALSRPTDAFLSLPARKWRYFWLRAAPWPLHAFNPQTFLGEHFFPWVTWKTTLILGAVGLGAVLVRRRKNAWLTPACFLAYAGFYMIFYGSPRFRLPAEGYFLAWSGAAVIAAAGLFTRRRPRESRWAAGIALLLLVILTQSGLSAASARAFTRSPESFIAAGAARAIDNAQPSIPLFGEEPLPLDRRRAPFLRLTFAIRREGPYRNARQRDRRGDLLRQGRPETVARRERGLLADRIARGALVHGDLQDAHSVPGRVLSDRLEPPARQSRSPADRPTRTALRLGEHASPGGRLPVPEVRRVDPVGLTFLSPPRMILRAPPAA